MNLIVLRAATTSVPRQIKFSGIISTVLPALTLPSSLGISIRQFESRKLLSLLEPPIRERGLPVPDVGFELTGSKDQVLAEAELAWPSQLLAVVLQPEDRDAFEQAGWRCWLIDDSPDSITNSLIEAL